MLLQFKLMILSIFMTGNVMTANLAIDMDSISNLKEVACLSQAVNGEAGNQSLQGKIAVAHVIMNRTKDEAFPETVCAVVKQKGQFDFLSKVRRLREDRDAVREQMEDSIKAAVMVVSGQAPDPTNGALYFANPKLSTDRAWLKRLKRITRIDDHVFYAFKKPTPRYARVKYASENTIWAGE